MSEIVITLLVMGWAVFMILRSERKTKNWILHRRAERYKATVQIFPELAKEHFADELKDKKFQGLIKGKAK